jgi:ribosomal protein S18 acetylase RimI-like enzyme
MEINVLCVERVDVKDIARFREMVAAYWRELMPKSDVFNDPERWEACFREQFGEPYWMVEDGEPVGLVAFQVSDRQARVNDFYIVPERRRLGYGTVLVKWLCAHLDSLGLERIDLDVRRDNPGALAFWEAQGFGLAGYRLRMYRNPERGTAFVGVLSSDF